MVRSAALASLFPLLFLAPAAASAASGDVPREPGVYWEQQVEMQMTGFAMPAQTMKVCLPKKGMEEPPRSPDDGGKCSVTDVKRTGNRMTWKMKCQDGTSGEGDMTSGPDSYAGTMNMRAQGQEMRMKMKGKKVGGDCDANELKRQVSGLQKQAAEAQADQARAQAEHCAASAERMDLMAFVSPYAGIPVTCQDSAKFCANLETRKGLVAFHARRGDAKDAVAKAEKLCKKDLAAIQKKLCAAASRDQEKGVKFADEEAMEFVFASCPDLAKALAKRECAGRSFTSLPRSQREFCTRWAGRALEEPAAEAPAAPRPATRKPAGRYLPSGVPDVDDAEAAPARTSKDGKKKPAPEEEEEPKSPADDVKSKIMKGIFGR